MQSNTNPPNESRPPSGVKAEPGAKTEPEIKAKPGRSRGPLLAGGLLAGAALAVAAVFLMRPDTPDTTGGSPTETSRNSAGNADRAGRADAVSRPIAGEPCRINPIVKAAQTKDVATPHGSTEGGAALIVKGKEAAAAGRDRDAEAAFLAACNLDVAQQDSAAAIVRADAKYNLARHYASLAQEGVANRGEMNSRAAILFGHSLDVYRARLGANHEKVRFATQALATLQDRDGEALRRKEQVAAVSRPSAVVPGAIERAPAPVVGNAKAARPATATATAAAPAPAVPMVPSPPRQQEQVAVSAPPPLRQAPVPVAPRVDPPVPAAPRPVQRDAARDAAIVASANAQRAAQARAAVVAPAPPPAPSPVPLPLPQRSSVEARVYPQPAPGAERYETRYEARREYPVEASVRPSFDCSRARSQPEKIICSDPQLARMDRDLGRVYARAKRAADDPRAFQRVSDREWRRREAECRDRECLVEWYRQRHDQLSAQAGDDGRYSR